MKDQDYILNNVGGFYFPHFDYKEYGVKGVGKNRFPLICMDEFIDHSMDSELHIECCKGLALADEYKMGMVSGDIPPEEEARFNNNRSWSRTLTDLQKFDPTGVHKKALLELMRSVPRGQQMQAMYKYAYFAMGSVIPWFYVLYLKRSDFQNKTKNNDNWEPCVKHFPKLLEYLKTLPFKEIGRVMFFTTYPNAGVTTHRDYVVAEHKDHNINLFFDSGSRPSFVWDEITKEKHYLSKNARSYFFNNRDYHGVDPEPVFRYTLRIDGTFTDELCEKLGLEDGYTWKWSYDESNKENQKNRGT